MGNDVAADCLWFIFYGMVDVVSIEFVVCYCWHLIVLDADFLILMDMLGSTKSQFVW